MLRLGHVKEWLSEFTDRQLHFILGLSLKGHYSVLDPLLLLLCQHEIFTKKLFLPVISRNDDPYKEVH
jgi:hypothetical protein